MWDNGFNLIKKYLFFEKSSFWIFLFYFFLTWSSKCGNNVKWNISLTLVCSLLVIVVIGCTLTVCKFYWYKKKRWLSVLYKKVCVTFILSWLRKFVLYLFSFQLWCCACVCIIFVVRACCHMLLLMTSNYIGTGRGDSVVSLLAVLPTKVRSPHNLLGGFVVGCIPHHLTFPTSCHTPLYRAARSYYFVCHS